LAISYGGASQYILVADQLLVDVEQPEGLHRRTCSTRGSLRSARRVVTVWSAVSRRPVFVMPCSNFSVAYCGGG